MRLLPRSREYVDSNVRVVQAKLAEDSLPTRENLAKKFEFVDEGREKCGSITTHSFLREEVQAERER